VDEIDLTAHGSIFDRPKGQSNWQKRQIDSALGHGWTWHPSIDYSINGRGRSKAKR
jgi:hypothetical protein